MNSKIIIIVLVVTNLVTLYLFFGQKSSADELRLAAQEAQQEATMQRTIAEEQQKIAEANAVEAMRQHQLAQEQVQEMEARLENCK